MRGEMAIETRVVGVLWDLVAQYAVVVSWCLVLGSVGSRAFQMQTTGFECGDGKRWHVVYTDASLDLEAAA